MTLSGKTALVTGAGRGIGKGCALELARRGASVVVNDRPDSPDLAGTVEEIRAVQAEAGHASAACVGLEANIFDRAACHDLLARAGDIDILVSNPAFSRRGTALEYDPDLFQRTLEGTLTAGFHMSQAVANHLVKRGKGGKILFISSVHGQRPYARAIAYNAAKAGLDHLARTLAVELLPHRINVNVIAPGWIDTPGEHETFGKEVIATSAAKMPWGRLGTPQDIGNAAAFLCSAEADYITGVVLPVDGGFVFKDCV